MKKFFTLLTLAAMTMTANAQLGGDGYYRVNNYMTGRYIYVCDNTGSINMSSTSVDMGAIQLWMGQQKAISDAATVLCIESHGSQYDITAQRTGIHQMIDAYVNIRPDSRTPGTYWAYGSASGMTKYLADRENDLSMEQGYFDEGTGLYRNWYITPIDSESDNYFGLLPTAQAGGKHYASIYADFPFSFAREGMKAYYVKKVDKKKAIAVIEEIESGIVPRSTPVIVLCAGATASDNRLNVGTPGSQPVTDNLLTGVYFNSSKRNHINRVAYNPATMRSLGVTSDGSIGLVSANYNYVPANTWYLNVEAGTPSQLKIMTQLEYETGITDVEVDADDACFDIYNLQGQCVRSSATDFNGLPAGIYVANGRKVLVP